MIRLGVRRKIVVSVFLLVVLFFDFGRIALAALPITQSDINQINKRQNYRDTTENLECSPNSTSTSASVILPSGSRIYMLGDSITNGSLTNLEQTFSNAGYLVSKINADGGRAISYDSAGNNPTGLDAIADDASIVAGVDAVIIALGTNSGNEDLSLEIPLLVAATRNTGFTGFIYWVNLFYTSGSGPDQRNAAIESQSRELGYSIIDLTDDTIQLNSDGVHPEGDGVQQFATAVVEGIKSTPSASGLSQTDASGACVCSPSLNIGSINTTITWGEGVWGQGADVYKSDLAGPYTIEQWAIHVLKNIALKLGLPEDTFVTREKVVSLIAWAKAEGGGVDGHNGTFNPLNTKQNAPELGGRNQGNAATDSNSNGYPTFDQGVEAITRGLFNKYQKRIGSALIQQDFPQDALIEAIAGDFYSPDGKTVINRLEEVYPGDLAYATLSITGYNYGGGIGDRAKYVEIKRSTLEQVNTNYESYAGKILDGSPPGTPAPLVFSSSTSGISAPYSGGACKNKDGGLVDTSGYSFPLAPQTKQVGGVNVAHHDETPALDLFSFDSADVYAIYSGVAVKVETSYKGVSGCTSIQFRADDGYFYWYGHLKNPAITEGMAVAAGTKIAEVADSSFGSTCVGGGPHLHIDRGCTTEEGPQWGGSDSCRDPEFITLMRALYDALPES